MKVESNQRGTSKYNTKPADENNIKGTKENTKIATNRPTVARRIASGTYQAETMTVLLGKDVESQVLFYYHKTQTSSSILSLIPRATACFLHPTEHPGRIEFSQAAAL